MTERADYVGETSPARPILAANQSRYSYRGSGSVTGSGGTQSVTITAVAGYIINISSLFFSCTHSCIQKWAFYINDTKIWEGEFDTALFFPFPESSAYVITEDDDFKVEVTNNDTSTRTMRINIMGTGEQKA